MKTPRTTNSNHPAILTLLLLACLLIGSGCAHRGADDSLSYIQDLDGQKPQASATTLIVNW